MEATGLNRHLVALLHDPRDLVFVHLIIGCAFVGCLGVGLFFVNTWFWPLSVAYLLFWGLGYLDRFILMLHCTSHRALFKPAWMKHIIPWVIGPFFGQTPQTYVVHHIGMHHIEDNLGGDLSTTMRYQRDSLLGWLHYLGSFLTVGLLKLAMYHWKKGSKKMFWRLLVGEGAFWAMVAVLAMVNWQATLVVFAGPVLLVRTLMMAGNWGQHAFIDPRDPAETYRSSITCINTRYNVRCFNDGYHTVHHHKPRLHYTEMPGAYETTREAYGAADAIVFDGIDFFQVWALLMLGQKKALARRFVRLPGAPNRTDDEVIAMMNSRLTPIAA
ncbi:MAG: fatty acid desaturase [Pseudomonadota bacterium]|nr:fatty acid desaturase [Pseudomonadota bacterium]